MLAVIGLGQAGSNIAEEAAKKGFLSGAINFSQKDLDSVNVKHKLRLLGSEGVGKDRDEAIHLFKDQWEVAQNFTQDHFSNSKIIVFAFASSGGSGSGISPILLEVLRHTMTSATFIAMPILPEISESATSQLNCLKTFEELSKLDVCVFPIDNQQTRKNNPHIGKNKLFELTNASSISLINKIVSYTTKHSRNGNFDEKDLITVLNTPGIATISEVEMMDATQGVNLSAQGISDKIRSTFNQSVFAPVDTTLIQRAALIFDGQESLMEYIQPHLIFNPMPFELFEGNYHECNGKVISILTGLSWSFKRLHDIELSLKSNQEQFDNLAQNQSTYQVSGISVPNKTTQLPEQKKSVLEILNKYKR